MDDTFEEYDTDETITAISSALTKLGVNPVPVIAGRDLPRRLADGRFDFAFNVAEGEGHRCREAVAPVICELFGIPYTGSDPLTLAVTLDKALSKRIVSLDVPVARGVLLYEGFDARVLHDLETPVIVKPNNEGSSKGIWRDALCRTVEESIDRCQWVLARYNCPVLVEEFLPGVEVTVGVRGNGAAKSVFGIMEIGPAHETSEPFLYSIEAKRFWRQYQRLNSA